MTSTGPLDTPFNMAMLFYMEVHELMMKKSNAVIAGDLYQYLDCLEELTIKISFKLTDKQQNKLRELFKAAKEKMRFTGPAHIQKQIMNLSLPQAKEKLRDIDRELMKLMHKYRMIFPKIETTSGLAGLKKRYGLNDTKK